MGYCKNGNLEQRIERHKSGDGSKLMRAVIKAGINFNVVRKWKNGDRNLERKYKKRREHKQLCPICSPDVCWNRAKEG